MRFTGVAMLGVVISVASVLMTHRPALQPSSPSATVDAAPANAAGHAVAAAAAQAQGSQPKARRVYPYSIVPGGVLDRAELARVLKTDKVAAAHYAAFQVDKVHPVTVARARAVYVSYRKGGQVYWTSRKVMLAEGETLLSDGSSEIRTRCGNRISDTAQLPVAANEPSPEVLDTAMDADDDEGGAQPVGMPVANDGPGGIGPTRTPVTFADGAGLVQAPSRTAAAMALLGMPQSAQPRPFDGRTGAPVLLGAPAGSPGSNGGTTGNTGNGGVNRGAAASGRGVGGTGTRTAGLTDNSGSIGSTGSSPASGTVDAGNGGTAPANGSGGTGSSVSPPTAGVTGPASGTQPSPTDPATPGGSGAPVLVSNDDPSPPAAPELPPLPGTLAPDPAAPIAPAQPNANAADVPEPGSLWLSGIALAAIAALRRKSRR